MRDCATSYARESIVVRRSAEGSARDPSELGLKQCSFHHAIQVLQVCDFCAFSSPPALPPCYFPLGLSTSGKAADLRDLLRVPSYWVAIQLELSRRTHRLHRWRQLLLCFVRHTGRFLQTGHMRSAMYTSCPRRRRRATRPSQTTGGVRPDRLSAWWQASPCFSMSPALPDGPAGGGVVPRRRDARERHPPGPSRHRPGS